VREKGERNWYVGGMRWGNERTLLILYIINTVSMRRIRGGERLSLIPAGKTEKVILFL